MKYALIGCGRIAVNHMKAALNNKLNIVAVCDVLPEKMEELLARYDLQNANWPPSPRKAASTPRSPLPASTAA